MASSIGVAAVGIASDNHGAATAYTVAEGRLQVALSDGTSATLAEPGQFRGYTGEAATPSGILLRHNGLRRLAFG